MSPPPCSIWAHQKAKESTLKAVLQPTPPEGVVTGLLDTPGTHWLEADKLCVGPHFLQETLHVVQRALAKATFEPSPAATLQSSFRHSKRAETSYRPDSLLDIKDRKVTKDTQGACHYEAKIQRVPQFPHLLNEGAGPRNL